MVADLLLIPAGIVAAVVAVLCWLYAYYTVTE